MTYIKKFMAIFCSLMLIFSLSGCGDSAPDTRVYFELPDVPTTVDPQTAHTASELIVVRNLFEGLLRYDSNGVISAGVAEEYSVDGLTYTFKLRKDAHWDSGEALTAHDFVFGIRRAVKPDTRSPFVSRLMNISGAEAINQGKAKVETLGVKALDEHTLIITLCREDSDFLHNLTTAPFMPCNEKFFNEAVGKYGLTPKTVLANGSYYLGKWNQQDFGMRLYRNAQYFGEHEAQNGAAFFSHNPESTPLEQLKSGDVDASLLSSGEMANAQNAGFKTVSTENICWFLTMGGELSADMRNAFAMLIKSDIYSSALPSDFRVADSFYPSILGIENANLVGFAQYNASEAKELFSSAIRVTNDKKFPQTVLKYYNGAQVKSAVNSIVAHWQQNLSAFINTEGVDSAENLTSQLKEQTMSMAVFPITADSSSLKEYLNIFGIGTQNSAIDIQKNILAKNNIIPIAFQQTAIAFSDDLSGMRIYPGNGYIDFAYVIKKD